MARRVGSIRLARREFYILSIVLCGGICKLIIMALRGAVESQKKGGGGAMDRFRSLYLWALRKHYYCSLLTWAESHRPFFIFISINSQ